MKKLLFNCKKLQKIFLTDFDAEYVINMNTMFENCEQLCKIDLSDICMENVIYMESMFSNCVNLKEISLPDFSNVLTINRMLYNCKNLKEFEKGDYSLERCEYMTSMFEKCKCLRSCIMPLYYESNPKKLLNMNSMFAECENLEQVNFEYPICPKTIENMFYNCKKLKSIGDQVVLNIVNQC